MSTEADTIPAAEVAPAAAAAPAPAVDADGSTTVPAAASAAAAEPAATASAAPVAAAAAAPVHEAKRFLLKHKEKLQMNQYWSVHAAATGGLRSATLSRTNGDLAERH